MIATIHPRELAGSVPAIASKSMAHRLIIAAALSSSSTHVVCNTTCDDIEATIRCLTALGARIEATGDGYEVHPVPKSIELGVLKAFQGATLDCGESGSTLRFMLPVACALGANASFTGAARLAARPLGPLVDELVAAGCDIAATGAFPMTAGGRLRPGVFKLPGTVSSQFISGLLLAFPVLPGACEIEVSGRIESRPYINLTLQALKTFGVDVIVERTTAPDGITELTRFRSMGRPYRSPGEVRVEGDWSNAAFWLCAGALGSEPIEVKGVSLTSAQGDRNVLAALSRFGARTRRTAESAIVQPDALHAFSMSAQDIPDLVPVIAAVAACCEGTTIIRDCARLRIKESDRLATTTSELRALGANVSIDRDSLIICGQPRLSGGIVESHNDHRIAMMAAVAAVRCDGDVVIRGAQAVAKSYPTFFEHYRMLGGDVEFSQD